MDFIPEDKKDDLDVPFFEEVAANSGWGGHATTRTIEDLKAEITAAMGRLGASVTGFQAGQFMSKSVKRYGYMIYYSFEQSGAVMQGKMKIAALPFKLSKRDSTNENKKEKVLKMALYMFRQSLHGMYYMKGLSPGYSPLIPWMIANEDGSTLSEIITAGEFGPLALAMPTQKQSDSVIDADFTEAKTNE